MCTDWEMNMIGNGSDWFWNVTIDQKDSFSSGLAAQTERLESLLSALDDHTGDVRLMKRHFGRTSSAVDNDREETPLLNMVSGPIPSGPFSYRTIKGESYVVSVVPEALSSGPSLHTTKRRSCVAFPTLK
jgi:hypothetical protein